MARSLHERKAIKEDTEQSYVRLQECRFKHPWFLNSSDDCKFMVLCVYRKRLKSLK